MALDDLILAVIALPPRHAHASACIIPQRVLHTFCALKVGGSDTVDALTGAEVAILAAAGAAPALLALAAFVAHLCVLGACNAVGVGRADASYAAVITPTGVELAGCACPVLLADAVSCITAMRIYYTRVTLIHCRPSASLVFAKR